MKLVYELNLPSINYFVNKEFLNITDDHLPENTLLFDNYKSKILQNDIICNVRFHSVLYLKKHNCTSLIHIDEVGIKQFHFGINFNIIGEMQLQYWLPDNVTEIKKGSTMNDKTINYPVFETSNSPDFIYNLQPNRVYLINASIPHCGSTSELKKTYSLRSNYKEKEKWNLTDWPSVINQFKNIIV